MRLNNILINLFFVAAINEYERSNNSRKAYGILKECEKLFQKHSDSYNHYIPLARFAYESGFVEDAKIYTSRAQALKGETSSILLNRAFFGILDNNPNEIERHYRKIWKRHTTCHNNMIEIISFLEGEKEKANTNLHLFDFACGFINKIFADEAKGTEALNSFIETYNNTIELEQLINLGKEALLNSTYPKVKSPSKTPKHKKRKRHLQ